MQTGTITASQDHLVYKPFLPPSENFWPHEHIAFFCLPLGPFVITAGLNSRLWIPLRQGAHLVLLCPSEIWHMTDGHMDPLLTWRMKLQISVVLLLGVKGLLHTFSLLWFFLHSEACYRTFQKQFSRSHHLLLQSGLSGPPSLSSCYLEREAGWRV